MKYIILFLLLTSIIYATKIEDVSNIVGVRENHIIGYSLVVGLKKTVMVLPQNLHFNQLQIC